MENQGTPKSPKTPLYVIIGVLAIASLAYRFTQNSDFSNSSILFVGLPAVIALLVINSGGTPKTTVGLVFKVITLFLLISGIVLGEGIVCIIISAPIFYFVGFLIAKGYDFFDGDDNSQINAFVLIPLAVVVAQPLDINKSTAHSISSSVEYEGFRSISALASTPDLADGLPLPLQIGFPTPQTVTGTGLEVGDQRIIPFLSTTKGIGKLVLQVESLNNETVNFIVVADDTHIGRWLTWHRFSVHIDTHDNQSTVTWTSDFTCDLGPQWYFEPIQKYAVHQMNLHLTESFFRR